MLEFLGLSSLDDLFAAVPAALRLAGGLDLAAGIPEPDAVRPPRGSGRRQPAGADGTWCASPVGAPTTTRCPP